VVGIICDFNRRRPGVKLPVRGDIKTIMIITILIVSHKSRYGESVCSIEKEVGCYRVKRHIHKEEQIEKSRISEHKIYRRLIYK
jgi:hypothetical protein